ncbi:alpha/beta hydrolase [Priestia megaterium]|nr:alpha/beta hydrolase [Priestia megaterium]
MINKQIKQAASADQSVTNEEVRIKGTEQIAMYSRTGQQYQIFISKPAAAPPFSGYPVVYLLDANSVFGTMVEAVRLQSNRSEKTGVVPAVIVGIGYPTDAPFSSSRYYDFTMPVPLKELPARPDGTPWPQHGGAEHFLTFIEEELKPGIEKRFKIDKSRETLFGHSLGGLFVLQTLFTKPALFQTYIAGSPSIHWNKTFFWEKEKQLDSQLNNQNLNVELFLGVGELEKSHKSRMNDHALELSRKLAALENTRLRVEFKEFEGEGHVSVLPPLINRALRFALSPNSLK